ncbi:LOW QUALITY PROTEIN: transcription cofactor vestigial-like protein 3 [Cynoglossus semilaevis]|uniref:LOW QUALITY PROTEIN: transcription cofactor vestigial-like protein 3 n=1 Tax=Cynoglossus semilaevis TaxID=244447 RepID=UPI000D62939E|nr:LOW QUALITY PROTEIN: transcription cofactor vestigial-like protein 3 [Cynoglossus semilaevis]
MSCLDVMYHQSYGAHYLPAAAAAAYKSPYYNHHHHHHHHHHQEQQQRKLSVYNKMQECMEQHQEQHRGGGGGRRVMSRDQDLRHGPRLESGSRLTPDSDLKDGTQPAEAEYLSSRCILFTYFQGNIGDVIDEHFSRALSQASAFSSESKPIRVSQQSASAAGTLWKDGSSMPQGQSASVWNTSTYPQQTSPCLPSVSVSVHPDFSSSPVPFSHPDGSLWASHMLSQASLPPPANLSDSWTYNLNAQSTSGYANVHDVYPPPPPPRPHHHPPPHHHHPVLHPYSAHGTAVDPRFNPLLLPGVRNQNQTAANPGSSPHGEEVKTEMDHSSSSPATATTVSWTPSPLQGSLETYDSVLDQTKAKTTAWF